MTAVLAPIEGRPHASQQGSIIISAILFGSISTLADTSELQRDAFNKAFQEHGLDWQWDRDDYAKMLTGNGGAARIDEFAASQGQSVDATAIHDTKSKIFQDSLTSANLTARPGVVETIQAATGQGVKLGLVTTTSRANIVALLDALSPDVQAENFDVITDAASAASKPDPAVYVSALASLGEAAADSVAIEDNVGGVESAKAAGLVCVAFPNENTAGHDFAAADSRVDQLSFAALQELVPGV